MNRNRQYAINGFNAFGPVFGEGFDIFIKDNCNKENSCYIGNDGTHGYKCHPQYKSSLFVNTNEPDNKNAFTVLDYEVYTHNYSFYQ